MAKYKVIEILTLEKNVIVSNKPIIHLHETSIYNALANDPTVISEPENFLAFEKPISKSLNAVFWENIKVVDKLYDSVLMMPFVFAWCKKHSPEQLELEFRNKNMNTHLVALPVSPLYEVLDNKGNRKTYVLKASCLEPPNSTQLILQHWSSYYENFQALLDSGIFVVKHGEKLSNNIRKRYKGTQLYKAALGKLSISVITLDPLELFLKNSKEIIEDFGKCEIISLGSDMNGFPVIGFGVNGKLISSTGFSFMFTSKNKKIIRVVNVDNVPPEL